MQQKRGTVHRVVFVCVFLLSLLSLSSLVLALDKEELIAQQQALDDVYKQAAEQKQQELTPSQQAELEAVKAEIIANVETAKAEGKEPTPFDILPESMKQKVREEQKRQMQQKEREVTQRATFSYVFIAGVVIFIVAVMFIWKKKKQDEEQL